MTSSPEHTSEHQALHDKAETLIEALPWLQRFQNRIIVIKFGGNAMVDDALIEAFASDVVFLRTVGIQPVVVHGGGPQISAMLDRLGIESEFRGGYRVTTPEAMEVVRMVLTGQVQRDIVSRINQHGAYATGISGEDAGLFAGCRRHGLENGEPVDIGLVGDITEVDPTNVLGLVNAGRIPVVSSIAPNESDATEPLNINADAAAAALAIALGAAKLVMLTDVAGLYRDWPNLDSLVTDIRAEELRGMLPSLQSGMIPKMTACLDAVDGGVEKAAIIDGRVPHAVLLEIFQTAGFGTEVTA